MKKQSFVNLPDQGGAAQQERHTFWLTHFQFVVIIRKYFFYNFIDIALTKNNIELMIFFLKPSINRKKIFINKYKWLFLLLF